MRKYTIDELALMSGLSTRTLRNYIKAGILKGYKEEGMWLFDADDTERFFTDSMVKSRLKTKNSALVLDFLANAQKQRDEVCIIIDISGDNARTEVVTKYFCDKICSMGDDETNLNFHCHCENGGNMVRLTLSGRAEIVLRMVSEYYRDEGFEKEKEREKEREKGNENEGEMRRETEACDGEI